MKTMKKILTFTSILAASAGIASANIDFNGDGGNGYSLTSASTIAYAATWANLGFQQGGATGTLVNKVSGNTNCGVGGFSFTLDLQNVQTVGTGNVISVKTGANDAQCGWGFYLRTSTTDNNKTELVLAQMNITNANVVSLYNATTNTTVVWENVETNKTYNISVSSQGIRTAGTNNFSVSISDSSTSKTTGAVGFGLNGDNFNKLVIGATSGSNGTLKNLSIVPEPSMFGVLAGLGALALVGARRRRK